MHWPDEFGFFHPWDTHLFELGPLPANIARGENVINYIIACGYEGDFHESKPQHML